MHKTLGALALILLLIGCSSMNKDECELANWQAVGYQEGVVGKNLAGFQEYQNDCAAHKIKADYQAFKLGHQQGLQDFCSFEHGKALGARGGQYNSICNSSQFPNYNAGYQSGIKAFCSHERGLSTGSKGQNYNGFCHSDQFPKYKAGYQAGVNRFCSHERGLSAGSEGADYAGLCPSEQFPIYKDAYYLGLKQYCSYDNGLQLALAGKASNLNCHHSEYAAYSQGYSNGKRRLEDIKQLEELQHALVALDKQILWAQKQIVQAEAIIYSETSTAEGRRLALDNIKQLQQDISQFELEYQQIEGEIAFLSSRLAEDNITNAVSH